MHLRIFCRPALCLALWSLAACQPPSSLDSQQSAVDSQPNAAVDSQPNLPPVAFSAAEIAAAAPVRALLERVVGAPVSQLELALVSEPAGQQASGQQASGKKAPDWYQLEVRDGKLYVSANALTALSFGLYEYLRQTGALSVSWEGNRIALPARFAAAPPERVTSLFQNRAYLNVCAYGYSTPWWDWTRWQQELDWMALHGVNNPVAMEGQEYIWQQLWREFGVSDTELSAYFSGPAFTPWQRMGNIEGHEGPLPAAYIEKKRQLQKQILKQMHSFGMKPVVPAFSGYVPKQFTTLFPQATISAMPKWSGFKHETYWLDPADPLFAKVAKRFIELYNAEYGPQQYYLLDAFNEMLPPVSKDSPSQRLADLAGYGAALYQSLAQVVPEATWVMQGWMFGSDAHFWDLPSIEAFLSKVPSDRLMVHDIGNDRFDVWQKAKGFYGKEWVFGFIHNYGASNPVYGDFDFYRDKVSTALHHADKGNLTGFGVFPEGIHANSSAYEFMFDLAWQGQAADTNQWLQQYLHSRYGSQSPALYSAWHNIYKALFSTRYWEPRWWEDSAGAFLLMKRPHTDYLRYTGAPGNLALLDQALKALLALPPAELAAPLLQYDLADFARHSATQHIDMLLQHTMLAYQQGKVAQGDKLQAQAKQLVLAVDALMAHTPAGTSRDTLYNWVAQARAYADTPAQAALYERNARQQVTVWGGSKLKDYASKAWHGMYAEFYWPRWQLLFAAQRAAVLSAHAAPFDSAALERQLIAFEQQWLDKPLGTPQPAPLDVVAAVAAIQALISASKAPPSNL